MKSTHSPARCLLCILFVVSPPLVADDEKGPFDLSWKVEPDAIVTYEIRPAADSKSTSVRTLRVHGHQLDPGGPDSLRVATLDEVGDPLVLALPTDRKRTGNRWRATFEIRSIREQQPFSLQGGYELRGWQTVEDRRLLEVTGKFRASPLKAIAASPRANRLQAGQAESSALVDPETGKVVSATVTYSLVIRTDEGNETYEGSWNYSFVENWRHESDDFQKSIDEAVDRGVAWLKGRQADDGSFPSASHKDFPMGHSSLCLLALLKSGVPRFDPVIWKGFDYLKTLSFKKTYSVSLLILALEARHAPVKEKTADGQTILQGGGKVQIPPDDKEWMKRATEWLLSRRNSRGMWSYPSSTASTTYDHSNVQYGVLALKAASRCGIEIPVEAWRKIIDHFLNAQESKGPAVGLDRIIQGQGENGPYASDRREYIRRCEAKGWGYRAGEVGYGSMTAAGLACLLLAQSGLYEAGELRRDQRSKIDTAVREGLAWMGHHYDLLDNPARHRAWYYYYLYGVERAMILSSTRLIAEKDWYGDGARILLKLQLANGSWRNDVDTCFALLFLKRATTPIVIRSGD